jgi:putative ABC transport system permease protein
MKAVRVDIGEGARIALFSLAAHRMRTVLATASICIGVLTLLTIVGILQGLHSAFEQQLSALGTHTLYVSKWPTVMTDGWWQYRNRKDFTLPQVEQLRAQASGFSSVVPLVELDADVAHGAEQLSGVQIRGVTHEYLLISGFEVTRGRFLTDADDSLTRPVAILGADVADRLFPGQDPVGRTFRIQQRSFQVVGTLARKGSFLDDRLDKVVLVPLQTFSNTFGGSRSLSIAIAVEKPEALSQAADQVVGILRRVRGTPPGAPDDFSLSRPELFERTYTQLIRALYGVAVGVGLLTLLVGGIGIMNIMLVSGRERTREIGLRRALGARRRTIVLQFLMEAVAVSLVGGVLGTVGALGVVKAVSLLTPLAAEVRLLPLLGGVGFSALVGLLFGLWPAVRAANFVPLEALRSE